MIDFAYNPLSDFAWANKRLAWQRQVTFAAGTILVALNQSAAMALACYSICLLAEYHEMRLCRKVLEQTRRDARKAAALTAQLTLSGMLGAGAIVFYVSLVAISEGPSIHIGPHFFLLMASLYTAMNTCQLPQVMIARLLVFSAGFLFIPLYDLVVIWPQQPSTLWTQLGTSVFVLYFVAECAKKFASHYQAVQTKMEDLRVERDKLAEAFEVQSQFVSTASHELRTPLTSILASLDLITDGRACQTMPDVLRIAKIGQKNGVRLATLINELLNFQKLNSKGMEFRLHRLDLRDLVREAAQVNRMLGKSKNITFEVKLPETPVDVMGDNDRLLQVMTNVLSNAVKFSHPGGVVEIAAEQDGPKGRISVRDHGIGIPEDARDLVFAPFAQVDGSDKRVFDGTGLGMSISQRIMDGHDGTIDFCSTFGKGTVFTIELDLTEVAEVAEVHADDLAAMPAGMLPMPTAG